AARFGIIVCEPHAFGGQLVEVRRLPGHDALVIGADVEPADIVAHDDKDVGSALLLLLGGDWRARYQNREERSDHTDPQLSADSHDALQYLCRKLLCVSASRARLCAGR